MRIGIGIDALEMKRSVEAETGGAAFEGESALGGGGGMLELMLGGSPAQGLVIGGGLILAGVSDPELDRETGADVTIDGDLSFGLMGALVDWYPWPSGGFHFGGLVGLAWASAPAPDDQTVFENIGGAGVGLSLQVGYDFWISREWALGPELRIMSARVKGKDDEAGIAVEEDSSISGIGLLFTVVYH